MIRVERREFSGFKIYDSCYVQILFLVAISMLCYQMAPKTQQHKVAFWFFLSKADFCNVVKGPSMGSRKFTSYIRPFSEWIIKVLTIGLEKFRESTLKYHRLPVSSPSIYMQ